MPEIGEQVFDPREQEIAIDCLERYSGSEAANFQPFLLLTNFPKYVDYFAESRKADLFEGSMFKTAHSKKDGISILDFKIGSPAAALVVDVIAHLPIKASLLLGMCGGLRKQYAVGDYFVPVAAIRGEGTSDFYFPSEVPAMANFIVQKVATDVLTAEGARYHIGITHSTNKRFWEFNSKFKQRLVETRPQAIEMECATLFMSSYYHKLPLGALLLISDLPLKPDGVKTKRDAEKVYLNYTSDHVEKGIAIMQALKDRLKLESKGVYRGPRKRFEMLD